MSESGVPVALFLLLPGALLVIGLVFGLVLVLSRRKPQPGLGLRLTEPRPDGTRGLVGGSWNALIHAESIIGAMGGTLGGKDGRFDLEAGRLSFTPKDAVQPAWTVPCTEIAVARGLARPIRLEGPMGTLHCTVSHEHVNRFTQNDLKDLRELRYASEFATALTTYGARRA